MRKGKLLRLFLVTVRSSSDPKYERHVYVGVPPQGDGDSTANHVTAVYLAELLLRKKEYVWSTQDIGEVWI